MWPGQCSVDGILLQYISGSDIHHRLDNWVHFLRFRQQRDGKKQSQRNKQSQCATVDAKGQDKIELA
tara:strand:- start:480 stop:680 length:201 start_codon:yes stop_codon:yes gene_type:complete